VVSAAIGTNSFITYQFIKQIM